MSHPASSSHYFSASTPLLSACKLQEAPSFQIAFGEHQLEFVTAENVFSRAEFDIGSQILLHSFLNEFAISDEFANPATPLYVCDLGCGWGPVGAFLKAARPDYQVFAADVNPRAAQLAHFNFTSNQLEGGIWCGDGLDATREGIFDVILCNPPVRAGNKVIQKLFDDAKRGLKENGELWVVLRTAQGAKSWQKKLAAQFGACETIEIERGFRILRCFSTEQAD